jgi:predicted GNAT family N-acyltransferase
MPQWKIIQPQHPTHWEQVMKLRFKVLREPWNQPEGSERSEDDKESIHSAILDDSHSIIATARINRISEKQAQIRFMAVDPIWQGKGLGQAILRFTEGLGRRHYHGIEHYVLHAREHAVTFYEKNGYQVVEPSYLLFDSIQHYLMIKAV